MCQDFCVFRIQEQVLNKACLSLNSLSHRSGIATLFLPRQCQDGKATEIFEVHNVAQTARRSWFLGGSEVISDGKLLILTRVDPTFLLIPILQAISPVNTAQGNYRTADDIFEDGATKLAALHASRGDSFDTSDRTSALDILQLCQYESVRQLMGNVCECKVISSELICYRFSRPKLLEYLKKKIDRLGRSALVQKSRTLNRELAKDGLLEVTNEALLPMGLIKIACDLVGQYVSPEVQAEIMETYDFSLLDIHLKQIQDDVTIATKEVNRVKNGKLNNNTEEKKRKASQTSTGVEKLKKANINGMSKLSSFFKKTSEV
ncbi:hypothetical protein BD410DRAFT_783874 [Rickenella mellea]|uniref:Ribonuclease H2 subunit B wHTH domain-containing protein n=1 Tax=Rickenella mellea TaxID=50990 RepID=A0A4Y7QER3_9AGAM|nr:hypothetical protein BD410DRAFT_783874 [Rickenella mellea]